MVEKVGRSRIRARATGWSLISGVLFASSGPLAKAVMGAGWSPAAVTLVRIALAAVLLVPMTAVLRPRAMRFCRTDLWLLLGYGLLGVAGVQLLFFVAVARLPVGVAVVLVNLAPALVALWVQVVRRTRLPGMVWLGIGLAVVGLALVAQIWQGAQVGLLGVAAGLGSAVCSAGYFLLGERGANRYDSVGLTAVGLAIGAAVVAVVTPPWTLPSELLTAPTVLGGVRAPVWLVLLVLAVAGTVLPYLAGLRALRDLPSARASVLAVVEPLVAAMLAWLLLGQSLGLTQIAGAMIMLIGAMLVQLTTPEAQRGEQVTCSDGGDGHHQQREGTPTMADELVDWYSCADKPDGNYPHPSGDTTKYMSCVAHTYAYERNCPDGKHYDPDLDACV